MIERPVSTVARCTGHCCSGFTINLDALTDPEKHILDGDYIRDMLVLLEDLGDGQWRCTCRHFDGRDCDAYEDRPAMCRDYPYGRTCTYAECTARDAA